MTALNLTQRYIGCILLIVLLATNYSGQAQSLLLSSGASVLTSNDVLSKDFNHLFVPLPEEERTERSELVDLGFSFEYISASILLEFKLSEEWRVGTNMGLGFNSSSLLLYGGANFSTDFTRNYEERDRNGEDRIIETYWFNYYLQYDFKHFGFQIGYRRSGVGHKNENSDGDFTKAFFRGFYFQPSFGSGHVKYAFRVAYGTIDGGGIVNVLPERAVFFNPVIITIRLRKI